MSAGLVVERTRMTADAKGWLARVVRELRERLLKDLRDGVESAYRLSIPAERAELSEERSIKRQRLESWLDEQVRAGVRGAKESEAQARGRHLLAAVKMAAATLLNKLVVLRQMEALGLVRVKVVTGGFASRGYKEFVEFAPALSGLENEASDYTTLLRLAFEELALDLPGLFGEVSINRLIPVPTVTLRATVEALGAEGLTDADRESLWRDDTLLGWVYQFWNDPEREALDEKIRNRGKIENHEIAAKTQLFTDRYMVEWLLQNSLGQLWFAVCQKNGWTPEVVADGTLTRLEDRRAEWRGQRERQEVDLEALMPLETDAEERWKYWVCREMPGDGASLGGSQTSMSKTGGSKAGESPGGVGGDGTPSTLRDMKLLDPACGSGHFLVIAFDLLVALYEEEARHRGESWSAEQIACWIVENNLHGLDIDPRAVQIAAAALWLKVKTYAPKAAPRKMNLVASNLGLGSLPADDPALLELEQAVEEESGIPAALTRRIVESLKGADYLGSLLKVSEEIDGAIAEHEKKVGLTGSAPSQGDLFAGFTPHLFAVTADEARKTLLGRLSVFLSHHTGSADLGLRLRGEQLAAGVRFIQMVREGQYDLVVGNPPYQGTSKTSDFAYLVKAYPDGKADICTAFLLRSHDLLKSGGLSLLVTIRGWLFIKQFEKLRAQLFENFAIDLVGDFDQGAFSNEVGNLLAIVAVLMRKDGERGKAVATLPTPFETRWANDNRRAYRKESALLAQVGRHEFTPDHLSVVPGHPLIYWWDEAFLREYASADKLGVAADVRVGLQTSNNIRFLRLPWEVSPDRQRIIRAGRPHELDAKAHWVPFGKGVRGLAWIDPVRELILWSNHGLGVKAYAQESYGSYTRTVKNEPYYFRSGIAFSAIGADFSALAHRYRVVFGHMGSSVFPENIPETLCLMNSTLAKKVLESLNPGVHFEVGDVNRLPLFPIESADEIVAQLDIAFTEHEQARESSVEFQKPGPSAWTYAQDWAQRSVDRPKGEPLPAYDPVYDKETPLDHLSYQLGVALGRFGADGEGILDVAPASSLPDGILFLTTSGGPDSLEHPATRALRDTWERLGAKISKKQTLREYLCAHFFKDDHLKRYEKRPIHFPLTSANKNFVAWVSIHRWKSDTLQTVLAEHLFPELNRLAGELADLGSARSGGDRDSQAKAQSRYDEVQDLHKELQQFADLMAVIAERGAPPSDSKCPAREADARFEMDFDDGVMINSAALWPLLDTVWKDPKKWWSELCTAKAKDYDWAHLAARYFPIRVDAKCQEDPSLAVAHGCFWKYHPEKATQWELRLQSPDELGPSFQLDEDNSDTYREAYQNQHGDKVRELRETEAKRRQKKADKENASDDDDNDQLELE